MHSKVLRASALFLWPILALIGVNTLLASVPVQEQIESAIVKITAYQCREAVDLLCQETKVGTGVIIDSRGLILTAYAVVSATQSYADDFEIFMNENAEQSYRATLQEAWVDKGLALLLIYYDETKDLVINKEPAWIDSTNKFPTAALSGQVGESGSNGEIIWWPADQRDLINTPTTLDTTTDILSISPTEGISGAPVVAQNQVVGLITGENNSNTLRVRWIAEMRDLTWQPTTRRVWVENGIAIQGITGTTNVQITATFHTLDHIAKPLAFLVYVFNEQRLQLTDSTISFTYTPQHFVDLQSAVMTQSLTGPSADLAKLRFRFLVWDIEEKRVLWRDNGWQGIQNPPSSSPVPPTPTLTPTPPPKVCPEGMESVRDEDDEFCMDIHEVTNAEYANCEACSLPKNVNTRNYQPYYGNPTFDNYPVVSVTWHQAKQYCDNANKSLPTAKQWKQAETMVVNRAAVVTQVIAFTDTMPVANNQQDKSTNNIFDLIGNVREWASDNSQEIPSKKNVMGLSYVDDEFPPDSELPDKVDMDIGFRCVR